MKALEEFLSSPRLDVTLDDIRAAFTQPHRPSAHYFTDQQLPDHMPEHKYRPAAVLIPLLACPDDNCLKVLVTQRSLNMRNHPGQIAFPGGKHDPNDASIQYTALRETLEEVGLAPDCFDLLGELHEYCTLSGFCIKPVVAELTRQSELSLCEDEVESVHWVPLNYLLDPANYRCKSKHIGHTEHVFLEVEYDGIRIWGATAGILCGLYDHLSQHVPV